MAEGITLGTLRQRFIDRGDYGDSSVASTIGYPTATQIQDFINDAYAQLWNIYSRKDSFFTAAQTLLPILAGQDVALPNDFKELLAPPYIVTPSTTTDVLQGTRQPIDRYTGYTYNAAVDAYFTASNWIQPQYELVGQTLRLSPTPIRNGQLAILYSAECTPLTNDADTISPIIIQGHEWWIVNQAVIISRLIKEEVSCTELQVMNDRLRAEIEQDLSSRDRGGAKYIQRNCYTGGPPIYSSRWMYG